MCNTLWEGILRLCPSSDTNKAVILKRPKAAQTMWRVKPCTNLFFKNCSKKPTKWTISNNQHQTDGAIHFYRTLGLQTTCGFGGKSEFGALCGVSSIPAGSCSSQCPQQQIPAEFCIPWLAQQRWGLEVHHSHLSGEKTQGETGVSTTKVVLKCILSMYRYKFMCKMGKKRGGWRIQNFGKGEDESYRQKLPDYP